jgi:hypothetical protein
VTILTVVGRVNHGTVTRISLAMPVPRGKPGNLEVSQLILSLDQEFLRPDFAPDVNAAWQIRT